MAFKSLIKLIRGPIEGPFFFGRLEPKSEKKGTNRREFDGNYTGIKSDNVTFIFF